ncbi:hypothetical protein BGX24_004331, partial [Mortierella sp. AD032]
MVPDPDPIKTHNYIPVFLLLDAILATIWRYHFAFVIEPWPSNHGSSLLLWTWPSLKLVT